MSYANARLTPAGRLLLVHRVAAREPQAEVARQISLLRGTVAKWLGPLGRARRRGLTDRSSRPNPVVAAHRREDRGADLSAGHTTKRGPAYLSARTGVLASTIWRILRQHGLNRLDRPTGRTVRRYERSAPGEPMHLDIKSRQDPTRGRLEGPQTRQPKGSPLPAAFGAAAGTPTCTSPWTTTPGSPTVEAHDNETAPTLAGGSGPEFQNWFWSNDIDCERCIHDYNCHRHHTAVGGPPASRANNLTRTDTFLVGRGRIAFEDDRLGIELLRSINLTRDVDIDYSSPTDLPGRSADPPGVHSSIATILYIIGELRLYPRSW